MRPTAMMARHSVGCLVFNARLPYSHATDGVTSSNIAASVNRADESQSSSSVRLGDEQSVLDSAFAQIEQSFSDIRVGH